jgi:LemA protein
MVAGMFNYQHFDYFEAEPESRENVKVSFTWSYYPSWCQYP